MASTVWTPQHANFDRRAADRKPQPRPFPLRVRTFSVAGIPGFNLDERRDTQHVRNKSVSNALEVDQMSPSVGVRMSAELTSDADTMESPRTIFGDNIASASLDASVLSPPLTPSSDPSSDKATIEGVPDIIPFDFSRIDYQLERAKVLGSGLWSAVYLAEPETRRNGATPQQTPPTTPRKNRKASTPSLFAIKKPIRPDAKAVFNQEARVLSRLQRRHRSDQFLVPFYGLDHRHDTLIFEAVLGGSLDNLAGRLKQMTEVSRHVELINIFPGIAFDLVSGLDFLHANGCIHADIKPGNVLLDMYEQYGQPKPVIRARYIDFSASFMPEYGDSDSNAGGTWDYLAPEQLRIQKELNTPTPASDVWNLGVTLLSIIVGGSPWHAACGGNLFMLREAIKGGDPIGFARMDPVSQKRLAACQDFVDCCRLALKKGRENRVTANGWIQWLEDRQLGF